MAKSGLDRSQVLAAYDVEELGRLLAARKAIEGLERERDQMERRVAEINDKIAALAAGSPSAGKRRGRRPGRPGRPVTWTRGPRSTGAMPKTGERLPDLAVRILSAAGEPMRVKDLANAALEAGYVTRSADFSRVVRILVYKEPRIKKAGRGLFTVAGASAAAKAGAKAAPKKRAKAGRRKSAPKKGSQKRGTRKTSSGRKKS